MASRNWEQNDNEAVEGEAVWRYSDTALQPSNFSSQWLLSPNATPPIWPQIYKIPFATTSGVSRSPPPTNGQSINPFDGTFGDAAAWTAWGDWDALGDNGNKGDGGLDGGLEAQQIWPGFTTGIFPHNSDISSPVSYAPRIGSSERDSASNGHAYLPHTTAKFLSVRSAETGNEGSGTAEAWSSVPSSYLESSDMQGVVGIPERDSFPRGQKLSTIQELVNHVFSSPAQTEPISSPATSIASPKPLSKTLKNGESRLQSAESGDESRQSSHVQSEKRYRTTLNGRFSSLLQALPDPMVEQTGPFKGKLTAEKSATKANTLDHAMLHIRNLEAEEQELKEESLVLEGQVAAYKRLLDGRGGLWKKWPET